jgi:pimeloyl-ACP methyl ester carboxylesterase
MRPHAIASPPLRRLGLLVLLLIAVALAVNTVVTDNETASAAPRDGGRVLDLPGGDLNVSVEGDPADPAIVLLHCFTCSIEWWERVAGDLAADHRVIRIDLLGHGGSDKPKDGYSMESQAKLVDQALTRLGVRRATVAGHSMGGAVATALAERSRGRLDGVVIVDTNPTDETGKLPLTARVGFWPVIGEALNRVVPDSVVENELGDAFAPGFDTPDYAIGDFRQLTYSAYDKSASEGKAFREERSLSDRLRTTRLPVLVVFGGEDKIVDVGGSLAEYRRIPRARVRELPGVGHSPPVERPRVLARLIRSFGR